MYLYILVVYSDSTEWDMSVNKQFSIICERLLRVCLKRLCYFSFDHQPIDEISPSCRRCHIIVQYRVDWGSAESFTSVVEYWPVVLRQSVKKCRTKTYRTFRICHN